jgi:flap endonuclease-1
MGIKGLSKFVEKYAKPIELHELSGQKIAIDSHIFIYKFKCCNRSLIEGFGSQLKRLAFLRVTPVYVFDGAKSHLKNATIQKRKEKSTVTITWEEIDELKQFLVSKGIELIKGVSEGEKTCSYLSRVGYVYAVLSNDYDCLTFNCKRLITYRSGSYFLYDTDEILSHLGLTIDEFISMCIVSGSDYSSGIRGLGMVKAYKKIQEKTDLPMNDIANIDEIIDIFKNFSVEASVKRV